MITVGRNSSSPSREPDGHKDIHTPEGEKLSIGKNNKGKRFTGGMPPRLNGKVVKIRNASSAKVPPPCRGRDSGRLLAHQRR
jgi:hypothetical protein